MEYVMYPVVDGVVVDGPCVAAGYSDESQEEARASCLEQNPKATGTARAHMSDIVDIGAVAGADLDVEVAR